MEGANGTLAQLRSVAKEVTSTGNRWRFIERATATEMRAGSASTGEYFELFAIRFASASLPTPLAERFPLAPWRFLWRILRRKYLRPAMPKAESFISQMVKNVRRPGDSQLAASTKRRKVRRRSMPAEPRTAHVRQTSALGRLLSSSIDHQHRSHFGFAACRRC